MADYQTDVQTAPGGCDHVSWQTIRQTSGQLQVDVITYHGRLSDGQLRVSSSKHIPLAIAALQTAQAALKQFELTAASATYHVC